MPPASLASRTTCPGLVAQRPATTVRSSSGPPGAGRATSATGGRVPPPACGVTVTSSNGPAAPVTSGNRAVATSCARVTFDASIVTAASAPRCDANAWSKGAFETAISASAMISTAVDISTTSPITNVCTRRRLTPARTARETGALALIAPPPRVHGRREALPRLRRSARPSSSACGWRVARPGSGCA